MLVHGEGDTMIRVDHSRRLHQVLPAAQLLVVRGAAHNDVHEFQEYRDEFRRALDRL